MALAQALKDYAVPASKAVVADQNGETTASSVFKSKLAAAGYFGLVAKEGDKYKLTERGEAALAGDDQSKRDAVMATGFGPIIGSLPTRQVSGKVIEGRLKSDYSATDSGAKILSAVLVDSATDAGLIVNDKFDAQAIESVDAAAVGPGAPTAKKKSQAPAPDGKTATKRQHPPPPKAPKTDPPPPDPSAQVAAPVQVVVQLDASKMEPAKIAELIRILQEPK